MREDLIFMTPHTSPPKGIAYPGGPNRAHLFELSLCKVILKTQARASLPHVFYTGRRSYMRTLSDAEPNTHTCRGAIAGKVDFSVGSVLVPLFADPDHRRGVMGLFARF